MSTLAALLLAFSEPDWVTYEIQRNSAWSVYAVPSFSSREVQRSFVSFMWCCHGDATAESTESQIADGHAMYFHLWQWNNFYLPNFVDHHRYLTGRRLLVFEGD